MTFDGVIIIIIIHEFHRDASLETKLQDRNDRRRAPSLR